MHETKASEGRDNAVTGVLPPPQVPLAAPASRWNLLLPLQVRFWRAAAEAVAGWFLLIAVATAVQPGASATLFLRPSLHSASSAAAMLGWIWAVLWPVWRMRQARGRHLWTRLPKGLARVALLAAAVGLTCWALAAARDLWPGEASVLNSGHLASLLPTFGFLMIFFRTWIDIAVAVRRWARTRLHRQLTVSYLLVIMVTFLGALGIGGITVGLLIAYNLPDPASQSRAIAEMLQPGPGRAPINSGRAQELLQGIASQRIRPTGYGGSPLNLLIPWRVVSKRIELVDLLGTTLAAVSIDQGDLTCSVTHGTLIADAADRRRLIATALAGHQATAKINFASTCVGNGVVESAASTPVIGAGGRPVAVVLVRGQTLAPSWNQLLGVLLVSVTAASMLLIAITVLPTLALSFLAALYFARGLTRGLGAVSRTAGALSAGDLTQRVPVTAQNEIGQLAQDFNRMAARLETILGELQGARRQAEQALQARQELVASVSHELRTPIAIVQAHLESLAEPQVGGVVHSDAMPAATLGALRGEMDRLTTLVDDLFSLARAGTEVMSVACVPTDVAAVTREVIALLGPLARREGSLTLTAKIPPGLQPALVDADRLRQILANLVRNAVRHTPEGGIIALSIRQEEAWVVLSVADTGEGIAPEHLPHIFERFYRVDQARTRASGGAGLGLAIVREFVELMGGRVTVESSVEEGTCFHVYLPRA